MKQLQTIGLRSQSLPVDIPTAEQSRSRRRGAPRRLSSPAALTLVLSVVLAAVLSGCAQIAPAKGWAAPVSIGESGTVLLVQTQPGKLAALELGPNGSVERWSFPIKEDKLKPRAFYATPVVQSGRAVLAAFSGDLVALDISTGRPVPNWGGKVEGHIIATPAFDTSGKRLLVATDHGGVYPVDWETGKIGQPILSLNLRVYGTAVRRDGAFYYGSLDRTLLAIDGESGKILNQVASPPLVGDARMIGSESLVIGTLDSHVRAFDPQNLQERWSAPTRAWLWASPLVVGDTVYAADLDGYVYALDARTGQERWRTAVERGDVRAAPVLVNGVIVLATGDGGIFGVEAASGQERWFVEPGAGHLLADPLVLESGIIYVSDAGTLIRVNPANGNVESLYVRK